VIFVNLAVSQPIVGIAVAYCMTRCFAYTKQKLIRTASSSQIDVEVTVRWKRQLPVIDLRELHRKTGVMVHYTA
jgi:hypothetical protein